MKKIETVEIDGKFFTGHHAYYLDEGEYDIIGYGKNREESLAMALETISDSYFRISNIAKEIVGMLSEVDGFKEDLFYPSIEFKISEKEEVTGFSYFDGEWLFTGGECLIVCN